MSSKSSHKSLFDVISIFAGIFLISLLAQIAVPLPWTPVPITGQTLGVTLTALLWGRKKAFTILFSYLTLGFLGLPIFALGKSGFALGPTLGYLIGMLISGFVVGYLADIGFTKTFKHSLIASYLGSLIVFSCGLICLSFFVPKSALLTAGLYPFLIGDSIKNIVASLISFRLKKSIL